MARSTAMIRSTSVLVATKPACAPLKEMYTAAVASRPRSWNEVEPNFVAAMEGFDRNVVAGSADKGDRQNGKGEPHSARVLMGALRDPRSVLPEA